MIRLGQKREIIILYFRENKSEISRKTGINRKTVNKYINEYEDALKEFEKVESKKSKEEIIEIITGKPKYKVSNRKPRKVTEELRIKIEELVKANELKRQKGLRKQTMPVTQMYEIIRDEGYEISIGTIYNIVKKFNTKRTKEAYIKQRYNPGEIVEFDWGEVKLEINGINKKFQMAVFTFAYSNYRYALLYEKQNMESFIDSHVRFFEHIGGINKTIVYDNMKVAIRKFVGHNDRELTDDLTKLSLYYKFDIRFCNVRKPNEKGHVEKSVNVLKQRAFSIKDKFKNIDDANEFLSSRVKYLNENMKNTSNISPLKLLKEEKEYLICKPPKYEYSIIKEVYVDKYSTITLNNCHYSVPVEYTNKWLKVKLYPEKIIIYDEKPIATHKRLYGNNMWKIEINHYLSLLKRKPGALHSSLALHQVPQKIKKIYNNYFTTKPKEFINLLEYMYKNNLRINDIEETIEKLERISPKDISATKIKILYENKINNNQKNKYQGTIEEYSRKQLLHLKELIKS
ncbi:transposase [Tepiditoga spiralis]|uniref:Transposase n=1 Tax=Tepiditoga spiralis TaxID=2108365 RepID=A0A7G1G5T4_9BACT|nr:IS21 family transposase [Tepiditoga spiralis]BBE30397.1 transposase [Tepiditoga spiralis]BBE31771.1 transposase [Tepiditoga spiralis]